MLLRSIVELGIFIRSDDSPTEWNCVVIMKTVLPKNFKGSHPNAKFPKQAKLTKLTKIRSYLSRTRVRLLGRYVAAKVTKCKITETVVTSVSTVCNAIFKIDRASKAWNCYPI